MGVLAACGRSEPSGSIPVVDLLATLPSAEQRPASGFESGFPAADGITRPAIIAPVPSRATWTLPLPHGGSLRAFLAVTGAPGVTARLRAGVSDNRIYESLGDWTIASGSPWQEISLDLSPYAGRKWSLFYHPDRLVWHLVLAADPAGGGAVQAVWGAPAVLATASAGREYAARRLRLRAR